jgi:hypothetical protein
MANRRDDDGRDDRGGRQERETREEREERERREREEWTPNDPLPDAEDEEEVDREARARARLNHLTTQYSERQPSKGKKKSGGGRGRLFGNRD